MRTARSWSTWNVTRSRWFTPTSVGAGRQRHLQLGLVVDLDQHVEADRRRRARASAISSAGVERGGDEQHAVGAHQPGVAHVVRRPVKSLRSTGSEHAARAACRSATEPPKNSSSVST